MFPSASSDASVLTIDGGILIGLLVMARLLDPARSRDRALFGATTAAFLVTYALWRWTETLPALELTLQVLWSRLFIAFEFVAILYTLMSILILVRSVDRRVSGAPRPGVARPEVVLHDHRDGDLGCRWRRRPAGFAVAVGSELGRALLRDGVAVLARIDSEAIEHDEQQRFHSPSIAARTRARDVLC